VALSTEQNPARGFLASVGLDPEILVEFQFNPTQLTDKRAVSYATLNAPALLMPVRQYSQGGDRSLSFTVRIDGLFDGPADAQIPIAKDDEGSIWPELNKYRAFLYPKSSRWNDRSTRAGFASIYQGQNPVFESPPLCRFGFGEERVIDCVVTDVGITEQLFLPSLAPLRAEVTVTLVEIGPYDPGNA
jgi:contractile injection system tube protein